jgi:PAS domain S-box-containing protein
MLFDDASRASMQVHITRALETGEAQRYELTAVRPDCERAVFEAYAVPERDDAGVVYSIRGTMQDITTRRKAEAGLAASEQRLELATRSAGIGIWDFGLMDGKLVWDAKTYELHGVTEQTFTGAFEDWQRRVHPDDWERVSAAYTDALSGVRPYDLTFRILWPSGEVRHLEAHAIVQRDATGTPVRLIGANWDITPRKREEAALSQLADIVASSDDAIIGKDLESIVTSWNRGAEKVFGYSAAEMVGESSLRVIPADRQHEEADLITRARRGESIEQFETVRRTRSGRSIEVSMTASPIRDAFGRIVGVSTVTRDISERRKLERQFYRAQRMESIGTLAGGIAHDLNNALTPILLSLDLLKASFPDSDSQELLDVVGTSAGHAADMVLQVLSFARGVEGKRLVVDMAALVGEVEKISQDTFPKSIAIASRTAPGLSPVLGDRTQLQQVLVNLCVNARDAMPGGGRLSIIAENVRFDAEQDRMPETLSAGAYVCLRVEDSGEGISSEHMERIFEPFFTTKEVGKGTGLGLSTSMAIINSHGGVLRVYSERAKGTTFTLYLPAHLDASAALPEIAVAVPRGNGELILVVDDEPAVRLITKRILESNGYRVVVASDGASALSLYETRSADIAVVLTDMMMPVMDGPTMIRNLRELDPAVKIIGTSGLASHDYDASSQSGLQHFVAKPSTADALLHTLHSILKDRP